MITDPSISAGGCVLPPELLQVVVSLGFVRAPKMTLLPQLLLAPMAVALPIVDYETAPIFL